MNNEEITKFKVCLKSVVTFNPPSGTPISRVFELVELILGNECANLLAKYGIHKFVREHAHEEVEIIKSNTDKEDMLKAKCMDMRLLQELYLAVNQKPQNLQQDNGDLFNKLSELRAENNHLMADNDHLNSTNNFLRNENDRLEIESGALQTLVLSSKGIDNSQERKLIFQRLPGLLISALIGGFIGMAIARRYGR